MRFKLIKINYLFNKKIERTYVGDRIEYDENRTVEELVKLVFSK